MASAAVIVTGVNGFVGHHVVHELTSQGYDVVGVARDRVPGDGLHLSDYVSADLTQPWPLLPKAGGVIHLAGLSAVGPSFADPQRYIDVNGAIVNEMAAWAMRADTAVGAPRTVVVSSGAVYDTTEGTVITEESALCVTSPYVASKLLVENLTSYYRRRGLRWIVARPFNHIGPGRGSGFLLPDLALQLRQAHATGQPLSVGDLTTARDYTDVRDVARAYRLLLETATGAQWVFNVCSGRARTGRELLTMLFESTGVADVAVEVDPSRLRPDDPRTVIGSSTRLREITGWQPQFAIESCIEDFVRSLGDEAAA